MLKSSVPLSVVSAEQCRPIKWRELYVPPEGVRCKEDCVQSRGLVGALLA
jgi:hypothetical protein